MGKEYIKPDKSEDGSFWQVTKETGKGTELEPHIHETIHLTKDGKIILGEKKAHTTIEVERKKIRIYWWGKKDQ